MRSSTTGRRTSRHCGLVALADRHGSPFLKWPGGKRWLAPALDALFRPHAHGGWYREPFLGGGAVFFAGGYSRASLSDANDDLVGAFQVVRDDVDSLVQRLRAMPAPSREAYRTVSTQRPTERVAQAARFLYLNKLAFNGLWRVNRRGEFNVPYNNRPPADPVAEAALRTSAAMLQHVQIESADFRAALEATAEGDIVYCDPPYTVSHNNNGFIRYNEQLFSWRDQLSLGARTSELADAGAHVAVSNAAHAEVVALYPNELFHAFRLTRSSRIAGTVAHRRRESEMLFVSRNTFVDRRAAARNVRGAVPASTTVTLLR